MTFDVNLLLGKQQSTFVASLGIIDFIIPFYSFPWALESGADAASYTFSEFKLFSNKNAEIIYFNWNK